MVQQIFADPRSIATEFQSHEEPERARVWIEELESAKAVREWSEGVAFSIAKSRMQDSALKWLLTKSSKVTNYTSFVDAFKSTFLLLQSKSDKLKAMMSREQGQRESL